MTCMTSAIYSLNLKYECTLRQGAELGLSGRAAEAVGAVFQALLEAALRDAAAGALEDEEDDQGSGMHSLLPQSALLWLLLFGATCCRPAYCLAAR